MARQGQSFATAQDARVIYPPQDENDEEIRDVPKDGRTVGEVLMRGNIVMKEVSFATVVPSRIHSRHLLHSISATQRLRARLFGEATSTQVI
jgi:hypothetical protein